MAGFDAEFVELLADGHTCPICHLAMREPTLTHCGHQFCEECMRPLKKNGRFVCAVCRTEVKECEIFPNNKDKREILSLKIRCDKQKEGCEWIGELRERDGHERTCGYVYKECNNKCGSIVRRKDMKNHLQTKCSKRTVACGHCACEMPSGKLDAHYRECDMFPVSCGFQCGETIVRREMGQHVSRQGTCRNSTLVCDFKEAGCRFTGKRRNLERHLQENMASHLSLLMVTTSQLAWQLDSAERLLSTTRVSLVKREHELDDLKSFVLKNIEKRYCPPDVFVYEWKLKNWSDIKMNAKLDPNAHFISDRFYTGDPGYCLRLHVIPTSQKLDLLVDAIVCQGKYDEQLPKSHCCKFSYALVDQQPGGRDMVAHREKVVMFKPGLFGAVNFTADDLKTRCYVLNDAILIQFCLQLLDKP